jgi:hypothetical protein
MAKKQDLLGEIESFLERSGMNESSFGHKTVNDGNLVKRLRSGGSVTLRTADKIRDFIANNNGRRRAA